MHYVIVAAIIVKALKSLLAQFSTKLNKLFIKIWEYLDTKFAIIYAKFCFPENEKNTNLFAGTGSKNVIGMLPFFHEAANVPEKKLCAFLNLKI